jgi:hypothetical protein
MFGFYLLVGIAGCQALGLLNQFLGFYGKFIESHSLSLSNAIKDMDFLRFGIWDCGIRIGNMKNSGF